MHRCGGWWLVRALDAQEAPEEADSAEKAAPLMAESTLQLPVLLALVAPARPLNIFVGKSLVSHVHLLP